MKSTGNNSTGNNGETADDGAIRHYRELVGRLTLLDDIFMKVFFKDSPECVEYVLRIILGKSDLMVRNVSEDYEIPSVGARSVRLDVYAEDSDGRRYDIEIQNASQPAIVRRARYYASAMTLASLAKGESYSSMNETYVVFICGYDLFDKGLLLYTGKVACDQDESVPMDDGCFLFI